jgi:hypothetical protein
MLDKQTSNKIQVRFSPTYPEALMTSSPLPRNQM